MECDIDRSGLDKGGKGNKSCKSNEEARHLEKKEEKDEKEKELKTEGHDCNHLIMIIQCLIRGNGRVWKVP